MNYNNTINEDVKYICNDLKDLLKKAEGSVWLVSGGGGFIGGYFLDILDYCNRELFKKPCRVICLENFISGIPDRISHLSNNKNFKIMKKDVTKTVSIRGKIDYIVHAASIASPTFYRKYPIETIESNVMGLKNLLDLGVKKNIKSFLFFSTSEIYGNPAPEWIPTPETYNGNVSCTGPRACYDESKRLGETLCVNYYNQYGLPVKAVRPFNVFGPGLRIDDKRVIPDFFNNALNGKKIQLLSNGSPTRSFCYISDAMSGFMRAILSDCNGEAFNIGNDQLEVSMLDLAKTIAKTVGEVEVEYKLSEDENYLVDNPQRRCPDLSKTKKLLGYYPRIGLEEGMARMMEWYKSAYEFGEGN
ncbi:MAG: NAD-dependent epimerase/dehydratase family protein [Bacillota bacterium]|nr:NAD-dependent epimerase/dehydratase family protein [Bacillota bacterium]